MYVADFKGQVWVEDRFRVRSFVVERDSIMMVLDRMRLLIEAAALEEGTSQGCPHGTVISGKLEIRHVAD